MNKNRLPFRLSRAGALAFAVGFALQSPLAQADTKNTISNAKNAFGKAGECVKGAAKAGLITGEAATKILGLLSDPMGAACIAQVTLPDPLTIGVSAAMVVANIQGKLHPGSCNQEVRDAAFEPIVDGISSLTGLKLDQPPLSNILLEGKEKAWDYLNVTPPASLVLSKVACGCTFIDNGINYETAAKVAKAYTEAGESCFAFAEAAVQLVCESGKAADKVCDLVGGAAKAVNNAAESLFQDSAVPWEEYYDTWWKYFEADYIGKSIAAGGPIGEGVKLQSKNGYAQVDPMAYSNKTMAEAKADSKKYFDNHKNSKSSAAEKSNWLAGRFIANSQPFIDLGLKQVQFAKVAKGHIETNLKVWDKEFDPEDNYGKQAAKIIALPKSGTVTLEKGLIPGGDAKTHIAVQFSGSVLTGYAEDAYKIWIQSAGGDAGRMTEALDIAYNKAEKKLEELAGAYKADKKASKEKDTVIPLRILVADGRLEKLGQFTVGDTCAGVIKPLADTCESDVKGWINAAAKELKDRCAQSSCTSYNYGKSTNGKYFPFDAIYKYSPTIGDRQDWVSNDKYNAVLKQADERLAYYQERIDAVGKRFAEYGSTHALLMGAWTGQCGAAIGQPGTASTPMCESMLSSAIASCLTEGNSALKGVSANPNAGAGATGVNAPTAAGAKAAAGAAGTGNKGPATGAKGATGAPAGAPPKANATAGAGKAAPTAAMGADLAKPAQCRGEIEAALQQYATRNKVNPGNDKPYPTLTASANEMKDAAKKAGTKPGDLSKTSGIAGINNAAPAASSVDSRKTAPGKTDPKAKSPTTFTDKQVDPNAAGATSATKQGSPTGRAGETPAERGNTTVPPTERPTIGNPANLPAAGNVRDAAGRASAPNAPNAPNAPALPSPTGSSTAPPVPPLPSGGSAAGLNVPPAALRSPAGLPTPPAPGTGNLPTPNSATLPGAGGRGAPSSANVPTTPPAPSGVPSAGNLPPAVNLPTASGLPQPSGAARPATGNTTPAIPAGVPQPPSAPTAGNLPPAAGLPPVGSRSSTPSAPSGSSAPAMPPVPPAPPVPALPPAGAAPGLPPVPGKAPGALPPAAAVPPAGLPFPAGAPRPSQTPAIPPASPIPPVPPAPGLPPAPGFPAAPGLPAATGSAGSSVAADMERAGCKPTPQARDSYTCATRQAMDACEAAMRTGKVAACVPGR